MRPARRAGVAGPVLASAVLVGALSATGGLAAAHDVFDRSEPAPGAVLAESPGTISVWFSDTVTRVRSRLHAAEGGTVVLPSPGPQQRVDRLDVPLDGPLPPGAYVFEWQAWTTDHHPAGGSIPFTIRDR